MVLLIVYQLLLLFIFQHLILAQKTTQAGNDVTVWDKCPTNKTCQAVWSHCPTNQTCQEKGDCNECYCKIKTLGPQNLKSSGRACDILFKDMFKGYFLHGEMCPESFLKVYTQVNKEGKRDYIYPLKEGFKGEPTPTVVKPGPTNSPLHLDRFGSWKGHYFSVKGDPYAKRAAPPSNLRVSQDENYHVYEVQKAFPAWYGDILPYFGQKDVGKQYYVPDKIEALVQRGYLRRLCSAKFDGNEWVGRAPIPTTSVNSNIDSSADYYNDVGY